MTSERKWERIGTVVYGPDWYATVHADSESAPAATLKTLDTVAKLMQAAPDLLSAGQFLLDQIDELINRHYGGSLPCTDDQADEFERIRALLASTEDAGHD